jgi:hypothetical protein
MYSEKHNSNHSLNTFHHNLNFCTHLLNIRCNKLPCGSCEEILPNRFSSHRIIASATLIGLLLMRCIGLMHVIFQEIVINQVMIILSMPSFISPDIGTRNYPRKYDVDTIKIATLWSTAYVREVML